MGTGIISEYAGMVLNSWGSGMDPSAIRCGNRHQGSPSLRSCLSRGKFWALH